MKSRSPRCRTLALAVLLWSGSALADTAAEAYRAAGVEAKDVLSGTVLTARVLPGGPPDDKQVVAVISYLTGKRDRADAVNVRLEVYRRSGEELVAVYSRDYGAENGGNVGNGNLEILDLDRDGVNEIITSYDNYSDPLIEQQVGEIIVHEKEGGFRTAWSGPLKYDATRAARSVPQERRDRYQREIDIPNTLRTDGITLFLKKKMIAVAGERLPEPKIVQETFPLRASNRPY